MMQIRQGEQLTMTGVLRDDNGVLVTDYTDKKLSVILINSRNVILESWSTGTGAMSQLNVTHEGVIDFAINGDKTIDMVGEFILEFKVTDEIAIVGEQTIKFQVKDSKIGKETEL